MLVITTAYYFLAFDPDGDPFKARKGKTTESSPQQWIANSVDKNVHSLMTPLRLRLARTLGVDTSSPYRGKLEHALNAVCALC